MAVVADKVIVELEAKLDRYNANLLKSERLFTSSMNKIRGRAVAAQRDLSGIFGGIAFGFAAREAVQLIDTYTKMQNALRVVGIEGEALKKTYNELFAVAQRNGAPVESLVQLYSRLSLAQKDLNITSADMISFTDNIAVALRVGGVSAQEARGALIQLSQGLGNGILRAEEFNSIIEQTPTIARAAAAGIEEAGGSVSKLRDLVINGELSSKAFFEGFQRGAVKLQQQVKSAVLPINAEFTKLNNTLINFAGQADKQFGITPQLAEVIQGVSSAIASLAKEMENGTSKAANFVEFMLKLDRLGRKFRGQGLDLLGQVGSSAIDAVSPDMGQLRDLQMRRDPFGAAFGTAEDASQDGLRQFLEDSIRRGAKEGTKEGVQSAKGDRLIPEVTVNPIKASDYPVGGQAGSENAKKFFAGIVDQYVDRVIAAESGGDVNAKNPGSSATGLGQFIDSTWIEQFKKEFGESAKGMSDEAILALRSNAEVQKRLIKTYAEGNAKALEEAGVFVDEMALHLSHFLGVGDAIKVLKASPGTPLSGLISSSSIRANPTILGGGRTTDDAIAYANRRANNTRIGAGDLTPREEALKTEAELQIEAAAASEERIASLQRESEELGKTAGELARLNEETRLRNEYMQAGIPITAEMNEYIKAQGDRAAEAASKTELLKRSAERVQEANQFFAESATSAFSDIVTGASSAEDAIRRLVSSIAEAGIQALLLGQGPLAGLFGTASGSAGGLGGLFGALLSPGTNATGTSNWRGGPTWVGEHGRELLNLPKGSQITPNHRLPNLASPGRMSSGFGNIRVSIDLEGANGDEAIKRISEEAAARGLATAIQVSKSNSPRWVSNHNEMRG